MVYTKTMVVVQLVLHVFLVLVAKPSILGDVSEGNKHRTSPLRGLSGSNP